MRFKYRHIIVMATLIMVLTLLVSGAAAKTLRVSCDWNENEPVYRWLEFAAKEFEKLNPGVQVVIQSEHRTFGQTVKQRILAGDIPDVMDGWGFANDTTALLEAIEAEAILDLTHAMEEPCFDGDSRWQDTFLPALIESSTVNGKTWAMPFQYFTNLFHYNKAIFADGGLEAPRVWDDFRIVLQKIKGMGIAPLGKDTAYAQTEYRPIEQRIVGADAQLAALKEPGLLLTNPDFRQALEMYEEVFMPNYQEGYSGSQFPAAQMLFAQSKVAMMYMGTWLNSEIQGNTPPDFAMDVFPFPAIPEAKGIQNLMVIGNCPNIVIPAGAPNKELAIAWLKFISSTSMVEAFTHQTTMLNGMRSAPVPPWAGNVNESLANAYVTRGEWFWDDESMTINADLDKHMQEQGSLWNRFFAGEITADSYLEQLAKLREKAWEQFKKFGR